MKKLVLLLTIILTAPISSAENYVSPESYAVNEADLLYYQNIPAAPKLNIDTLESMRFKDSEPTIQTAEQEKKVKTKEEKVSVKKEKTPKVSKKDDPEAYKRKVSYKLAKWWVDQRYKREEEHHGTKHEIKVKARMDYEKRLEEQQKSN